MLVYDHGHRTCDYCHATGTVPCEHGRRRTAAPNGHRLPSPATGAGTPRPCTTATEAPPQGDHRKPSASTRSSVGLRAGAQYPARKGA